MKFIKESFLDDTSRFEYIRSKQVLDFDDFYTDYTWYKRDDGLNVFVFGDNEVYTPEDGDFDFETENDLEAAEWFDSYNGFEDLDEDAEDHLKLSGNMIEIPIEDNSEVGELGHPIQQGIGDPRRKQVVSEGAAVLDRQMSNLGGTLSSVLLAHKDEVDTLFDKNDAIEFLDRILPEVKNKSYVDEVKQHILTSRRSPVEYFYNIILKGDGDGTEKGGKISKRSQVQKWARESTNNCYNYKGYIVTFANNGECSVIDSNGNHLKGNLADVEAREFIDSLNERWVARYIPERGDAVTIIGNVYTNSQMSWGTETDEFIGSTGTIEYAGSRYSTFDSIEIKLDDGTKVWTVAGYRPVEKNPLKESKSINEAKSYNIQYYQIFSNPEKPTDKGKMIAQAGTEDEAKTKGDKLVGKGNYLIKAVCDDGKVRDVDLYSYFNESLIEAFQMTVDLDMLASDVGILLDADVLGESNWIEVFPTSDSRPVGNNGYILPLEITGPNDDCRKATFVSRGNVVDVKFRNGSEAKCYDAKEIARFIAGEFGLTLN